MEKIDVRQIVLGYYSYLCIRKSCSVGLLGFLTVDSMQFYHARSLEIPNLKRSLELTYTTLYSSVSRMSGAWSAGAVIDTECGRLKKSYSRGRSVAALVAEGSA